MSRVIAVFNMIDGSAAILITKSDPLYGEGFGYEIANAPDGWKRRVGFDSIGEALDAAIDVVKKLSLEDTLAKGG